MAKALEAVKGFFKKLPLKAPWEVKPCTYRSTQQLPFRWPDMLPGWLQVTGVASSLEYRSHLVQPGTWRKHAPGLVVCSIGCADAVRPHSLLQCSIQKTCSQQGNADRPCLQLPTSDS